MRGLLLLALVLSANPACKAKIEYKDTPATLDTLKKCQDGGEESKKLITSYEAEIRRLEANSGAAGGDIVVTIEGDTLTVKPGRPGAVSPVDTKVAEQQSRSFVDIVSKSRGPIQKCYEQALKKDTNLQARTVTLRVSASFAAGGQFQRTSFAPSISEAFDTCLRSVASKWQLPSSTQAMTFQAQVSLNPS
jgi:predicted AAA+ superfamily ATPase